MRAKRIDDNQKIIVKQLRICGVTVVITSMVGNGFPDLILGWRGRNYMIELKDGNKFKSQKQLTPDEKEFHDSWKGQINKCETFDQIASIIGL